MNILNVCLLVLEVFTLFMLTVKLYKKYGFDVFIYIIVFCLFLSNIFIIKKIEVFSFEINLGIVLNLMIYIISNIMIQKKGPDITKKILIVIILTTLFSYTILSFSGLLIASDYNKYTNIPYNNLFEYNIRLYLANLISLIVGIILTSKLYYFIKKTKNKIWISNSLTTIIIQFFEAIIFIAISYSIELETVKIIFLILSRYIIRTFIGLLGVIIISFTSKIDD